MTAAIDYSKTLMAYYNQLSKNSHYDHSVLVRFQVAWFLARLYRARARTTSHSAMHGEQTLWAEFSQVA